MFKKINFRILYTLLSAIIIVSGAYLAIAYAKGSWRLGKQGILPESGLLNANSFPTGAQVLVNDKLVTATDDTIYLEPGIYNIKIIKEGYSLWEKQVIIEKELVTQTNAQLFPTIPSLIPLTFSGVENISPSPDGQKILYYTASASTQAKNGLYILELNDNILPLQKSPKQVALDSNYFDLAQAQFIWSPDSSKVMILAENKEVVIALDKTNDLDALSDISFQRKQMLSEWEEEMYIRERQFLAKFPKEIIAYATQSAKNVYISPDKKRLLYTATEAATLTNSIIPPMPASNSQPQTRQLEPNGIYIYDREEDKNFRIGTETGSASATKAHMLANDLYNSQALTLTASPSAFTNLQASTSAQTAANFANYHSSLFINTLQWYPDSKHILFSDDQQVVIMEYDATNKIAIYSGPFDEQFIYPWTDGSRIIILTSFSPDTPKNLYAIEIK